MTLWKSLQGMFVLEIVSANPKRFLKLLNEKGITLYNIVFQDELTVRSSILRKDYPAVASLGRIHGNTISIRKRMGLYWRLAAIRKRPVLVFGLTLLILLAAFLPTRVLFFTVEGNASVSDRQILEAAENCGIRFGASRRVIRSEKMKNELLSALPQLQWAGINTRGCHAIISVREGSTIKEQQSVSPITKMVAVRDGIITSCTVTKGNAVCSVGQSVQKGQQLISPYVDCGIVIKAGPVDGEVYGRTNQKICAVTPAICQNIRQSGEKTRRCSLIIGKKRINFWKGSGISDTICGRMYEEYCITLPGGFQLPVSVGMETLFPRNVSSRKIGKETADTLLRPFAAEYIRSRMIAGTIVQESGSVHSGKDIWQLEASYLCDEMIGRIVAERNGETNE